MNSRRRLNSAVRRLGMKTYRPMFVALLICTGAGSSSVAQKACQFKAPVGETGLRKQKATKTVRPTYPEDSLKNHVTGKVIAKIIVDQKGKVSEATVEQAPDRLTGESVVAAAKQWEFKPP